MDSGAAEDPSSWPARNRRRWLLVVKHLREGLTEFEAAELAALEQEAERVLQDVGPLPIEELENLYSQLSQQDR